jgi:hypothetical protein
MDCEICHFDRVHAKRLSTSFSVYVQEPWEYFIPRSRSDLSSRRRYISSILPHEFSPCAIPPFSISGLDLETLDLVLESPDLAHQVGGLVGRDGRCDD